MTGNVLLLFARRPEPGQVKTRLAATLGDRAALAIYRELLARAAALVHASGWQAIWVLTGRGDWDHPGEVWEQVPGDLGERMQAASDRAFDGGARRVVIAGTDVPDLQAGHVQRMFEALQGRVSWVTIPTVDGGYAAVGMTAKSGPHFLRRTWSHSAVHAEEITRALGRGEPFLALPCLADVDEEADWRRWKTRGGT